MKKTDWCIICGVLLLALVGLGIQRLVRSSPATYVNIYIGETLYASVTADDDQTITIDQGDGKVNVVVISKDGVRMESSTCKNQICVLQGVVNPAESQDLLVNRSIICLPNGVSVTLSDSEG